jgi:hypothetical protein
VGLRGAANDPARELPYSGFFLVKDGIDQKGNLYTTSGGGPVIQITSPEGKPLGRLHMPQPTSEPRVRICATNVAFGDADSTSPPTLISSKSG